LAMTPAYKFLRLPVRTQLTERNRCRDWVRGMPAVRPRRAERAFAAKARQAPRLCCSVGRAAMRRRAWVRYTVAMEGAGWYPQRPDQKDGSAPAHSAPRRCHKPWPRPQADAATSAAPLARIAHAPDGMACGRCVRRDSSAG
jgi:hypothetical protein